MKKVSGSTFQVSGVRCQVSGVEEPPKYLYDAIAEMLMHAVEWEAEQAVEGVQLTVDSRQLMVEAEAG